MATLDQVQAHTAQRGYLPIAKYGIIGDCRTAALVAPDGSIDWCSLPHFADPAPFCRILDAEKGGYFQVCPLEKSLGTMHYDGDTNILQTNFIAEHSHLNLIDFMPIRLRKRSANLLNEVAGTFARILPGPMRRSLERQNGNDVAAAHRIVRIATAVEGDLTIDVTLKATFDYARQAPAIEVVDGRGQLKTAILHADNRYLVYVINAPTAFTWEITDGVIHAQVPLRHHQRVVALVNYARDLREARELVISLREHNVTVDLLETRHYWLTWARQCQYVGPYSDRVIRSALTLKLCTYEPTGAIVAAPTTSLPEAIGGVRNWDYRFTWLRDASLTFNALGNLGYTGEARDYFHFLHSLNITQGQDLRIMYGIHGEKDGQLAEQELSNLAGYRGSRPVRIGNGAAHQHQMDIYGELLDAAYSYTKQRSTQRATRWQPTQREIRRLACVLGDYVAAHWQEEDRGIWEVRGAQHAFVYSRAMCWIALDRALKILGHHIQRDRAARWGHALAEIQQEVLDRGYNQQLQSFTQYYDAAILDAANLRLAVVGFLPVSDPRIVGTVAATTKYLTGKHGLIYGYRPAEAEPNQGNDAAGLADDGLPGKDNTFLACSFWLVRVLASMGRVEEAKQRFEDLLQYASPLGLYSEELDDQNGELIGNFPQAFSHIGLIDAAVAITDAMRQGES